MTHVPAVAALEAAKPTIIGANAMTHFENLRVMSFSEVGTADDREHHNRLGR